MATRLARISALLVIGAASVGSIMLAVSAAILLAAGLRIKYRYEYPILVPVRQYPPRSWPAGLQTAQDEDAALPAAISEVFAVPVMCRSASGHAR